MSEDRFTEHLEQASETVRNWPAWKRAVLGPDPEIVAASMKDIDEGRTTPIQEIIDELEE
jgi:hypothetical protein